MNNTDTEKPVSHLHRIFSEYASELNPPVGGYLETIKGDSSAVAHYGLGWWMASAERLHSENTLLKMEIARLKAERA